MQTALPTQIRSSPFEMPPTISKEGNDFRITIQPLNATFAPKTIVLSTETSSNANPLIIGRQVNAKTLPQPNNGYFDSKVLSRVHAHLYAHQGQVFIKDVKSSNGTFINGQRLSEEGQESAPLALHDGDLIEFGVDIMKEDGLSVLYNKVSARIQLESIPKQRNSSNVLESATTKLNSTADAILQSDTAVASLTSTNAIFQQLLRQATAEQRELLVQLQKQIPTADQNALGAKHASLLAETERLRQQVQDQARELTEARKHKDNLTLHRTTSTVEFNLLKTEIKTLKEHQESLIRERDAQTRELDQLKRELKEAHSQQHQQQEIHKQLQVLRDEKQHLQAQVASLNEQRSLEQAVKQSLESELLQVNAQWTQAQDNVASLTEKFTLSEKETKSLQVKVASLTEELQEKEKQLLSLQELVQETEQVAALKAELLSTKETLAQMTLEREERLSHDKSSSSSVLPVLSIVILLLAALAGYVVYGNGMVQLQELLSLLNAHADGAKDAL